MSHSKRNTSRPVFTAHERALAKSHWASSSARLSRDSFLPFGSCGLCLEIARDPVACPRGDVFCHECALSNILAQKKELKRAERSRRDAEEEDAKARVLQDEEEQARAVRDFELTQVGLGGGGGGHGATKTTTTQKKSTVGDDEAPHRQGMNGEANGDAKGTDVVLHAGSKRKFALDEDELSRIAQEDKIKARKAIEDEKAAKPSLPSFWTPSLTPDVQDSKLAPATKKTKTTPICPASSDANPHPISMQKLISLNFHEVTVDHSSSKEDRKRSCPSCLKELTNASSPVMAKPCGHVLCMSCVKKFLIPQKPGSSGSEPEQIIACYVCDSPIPSKVSAASADASKPALPSGLVPLKSEGTGFSARGSNTVERSGVAFQC